MDAKRSRTKDLLVWTLIYGGSILAQTAIMSTAVAAGLITRGMAFRLGLRARSSIQRSKDKAWAAYKKNGSIREALDSLNTD